MKAQEFTTITSFPIPVAKVPLLVYRPAHSRVAFCLRFGVLCLCAYLFGSPAFADVASSIKELSEWQKKIKDAAERGDMNLADRNATGAMQLVSNNPAAYDKSMVEWNIFTPVKDLISSYRKNRKYDRANYLNNYFYNTEQKLHGANSVELIDPITELALTLEAQNKLVEAEARYKQAIALADRAPYIDQLAKSKVLMTCMYYSQLLRKMGRDKESQTMMESYRKYQ